MLVNIFKRVRLWFAWGNNPNSDWYFKGSWSDRWFGNYRFHRIALILYVIVAVAIPVVAFGCGGTPSGAVDWLFGLKAQCHVCRWARLFLGAGWFLLLTLGLPLFIWCERMAFEDWVSRKPSRMRDKLIARFELNAKHMETFWKTVAGIYLAGGLLSFSSLGKERETEKLTKGDVRELIQRFNDLINVARESPGKLDSIKNESKLEDKKDPSSPGQNQ